MTPNQPGSTPNDPDRIADNSRHEREDASTGGQIVTVPALDITAIPDRMAVWMERYQTFAVAGVRSMSVATKIALHLGRFRTFFEEAYGHDRLSVCLQRDVAAWQRALVEDGVASATVNNHLASLSAFTSATSTKRSSCSPTRARKPMPTRST